MEKVNIIYRVKRYGKWQPLTVEISSDLDRDRRGDAIKEAITKEIGQEPLEWQRNDRA